MGRRIFPLTLGQSSMCEYSEFSLSQSGACELVVLFSHTSVSLLSSSSCVQQVASRPRGPEIQSSVKARLILVVVSVVRGLMFQ